MHLTSKIHLPCTSRNLRQRNMLLVSTKVKLNLSRNVLYHFPPNSYPLSSVLSAQQRTLESCLLSKHKLIGQEKTQHSKLSTKGLTRSMKRKRTEQIQR